LNDKISQNSSPLPELYRRQLELRPQDDYLRGHAEPGFIAGTEQVFEFYRPWLPATGRLLDWGCRHAPDACLIRARCGETLALDGCDVVEPEDYAVFHSYAGLQYQQVHHAYQLPYADSTFDAVLAAGVLEHVPMDYESLKELYRVMKPDGRLLITYLPNRTSIEEWRLRRRANGLHHRRLYARDELRAILQHAGFEPLVLGYQTQLDLLPLRTSPLLRTLSPLRRFTACLCSVAAKRLSF
jgi:SAM-dependent methyltransferase